MTRLSKIPFVYCSFLGLEQSVINNVPITTADDFAGKVQPFLQSILASKVLFVANFDLRQAS